MIHLQDTGDLNGRMTLNVAKVADDFSFGWQLALTTGSIPSLFRNSRDDLRDVDLSIIDFDDYSTTDSPDSILLPVALIAVTNVGGKIKRFYRQRIDSQSKNAPILSLDCFVVGGEDDLGDLSDPHILVSFKVKPMSSDSNSSGFSDPAAINGNTDHTNNLDTMAAGQTRPHVDRNENANGGMDLPVGDRKSDDAEQERNEQTLDYSQIDNKGKVPVVDKQDA